MKNFKSHFWYSKSQRNGIFLLLVVIVIFQILIFKLDDFFPEKDFLLVDDEVKLLENKIDSLRKLESKRKNKIHPFNPNFISDYKGYLLGMSIEEIDRLHHFRNQNKYVNSKEDFQAVTQVNDSLLNIISPYFKFPSWVKSNKIKRKQGFLNNSFSQKNKVFSERTASTNDINLATVDDFKLIQGIGEKRAKRIVKYRNRLQGFTFNSQLYEVWNVPPELISDLLSMFKIKTKPDIKKVNVNTASFKTVLANPYIDYELCKQIFDYRDEVAELQNISELKNIPDFPLDKYKLITVYLKAE